MFRWCAYCQRLIGETAPLVDYSITHGICERCAESSTDLEPAANALVARDLLADLTRLGERGDLSECEGFVRRALAAGLRPSEILLGLVHPALGEIGARWEAGRITVADEHRFTAFVTHVLHLVPLPETDRGGRKGAIVLAVVSGNQHDLGVQMLQRVAMERGHPCQVVHPGLPDDEIVGLVQRERPRLLGLSVSTPDRIEAAARLGQRVRRETDTRVALGGGAFRVAHVEPPPAVSVLRTIDDFLAELERL